MTWKYFLHYWPLVWGIHRSQVDSHHRDQWCRALMFSVLLAWRTCWTNSQITCDLWCCDTHITSLYCDLRRALVIMDIKLTLLPFRHFISCHLNDKSCTNKAACCHKKPSCSFICKSLNKRDRTPHWGDSFFLTIAHELLEVWYWISIGSGNGYPLVWCGAIT